jgi:ABC-2 type transport system permease protein
MTALQKIKTIATFEFLTAVKRAGYLIATFGMPLFVAAYGVVVAVPAYFAQKNEDATALYGVVDEAAVLSITEDVAAPRVQLSEELKRTFEALGSGARARLDAALEDSNFVFRPFPTEGAARSALAARDIKGYFVLPKDYIASGAVDVYSPDTVSLSGSDSRSAFGSLVRQRLVAGRVEAELGERLVSPLKDPRRFSVTRAGEVVDGSRAASAVRVAIPLVFTTLFLMSVLMTSGYLMQGTATEKENKVVEVLLASANPQEILAGKLIGLAGAGLLQISVWLLMVFGTGVGVVPMLLSSNVTIPLVPILLAVPLFLIAFLFFGSLILGTGSLGSNMREAQQLAMAWSLLAALPLIMLGVLLREPHGTLGRVLTWIPFTAAPTIMLRASMDASAIAWWEVAGSILLMLAATWFAIRVGARLFRVGLLSVGARPSFREIIRQARLAD